LIYGLYYLRGQCDHLGYILRCFGEDVKGDWTWCTIDIKCDEFKIYLNGEEIYNGVEFKVKVYFSKEL